MAVGLRDNIPDEVLYQARVHPQQRCNSLSEEQLQALHREISHVCAFAVEVNADDSKFPDDWLFKYRWVNTILLFLLSLATSRPNIDVVMKGQGQKGEGGGWPDIETSECFVCSTYDGPHREHRTFSRTVDQQRSSGSLWAAVLRRTS
jgi:hypothetical protein